MKIEEDVNDGADSIVANSWLASCNWWRKPYYPVKTIAFPQLTGSFLTCPKWDSNQGSSQKQLAVSGNLPTSVLANRPTCESPSSRHAVFDVYDSFHSAIIMMIIFSSTQYFKDISSFKKAEKSIPKDQSEA